MDSAKRSGRPSTSERGGKVAIGLSAPSYLVFVHDAMGVQDAALYFATLR